MASAACSNAGGELVSSEASAPTVAGIATAPTTIIPPPSTGSSSTIAPSETADTGASTTEPAEDPTGVAELSSREPTGLDVPILLFGDSIALIEPDGAAVLVQRDRAIRAAGDTLGGVVFQRDLAAGPRSSILWQQGPASVPQALLIPEPNQQAELHGITTVNGVPEAVFSVTSPDSDNRSLNRIDLATGLVVELRVVDEAEFGSKNTQVDGLFIVTTWERPNASGWSVYQSGTGREIGGSFPDVETSCSAGVGPNCAVLASLSLDIETVFRVVPHDGDGATDAVLGYDLLLSSSENGSTITRVDLSSLAGQWYPENLSELPDGRILLSRSVDPALLEPINAVVIDPTTGSIELLPEVGFVRLT